MEIGGTIFIYFDKEIGSPLREEDIQYSKNFFMPYFLTLAVFYWRMVIAMGWAQEWLEKKLMILGESS